MCSSVNGVAEHTVPGEAVAAASAEGSLVVITSEKKRRYFASFYSLQVRASVFDPFLFSTGHGVLWPDGTLGYLHAHSCMSWGYPTSSSMDISAQHLEH